MINITEHSTAHSIEYIIVLIIAYSHY